MICIIYLKTIYLFNTLKSDEYNEYDFILNKTKKKKLKRINKKGFGGNCFHHIHLILIIFYVMHILFEKKMKKKERHFVIK